MADCQQKPLKNTTNFSYALKSFLGYLEGTAKSIHTVNGYKSDLETFKKFLQKGLQNKSTSLRSLTLKDLVQYHAYLKKIGQKTNTRRRRVLTVRKLLRYLNKRKKFPLDISYKIPAPYKIERIPYTISLDEFIEKIKQISTPSTITMRNRALLWLLAETGCLVSEISLLKFEHFRECVIHLRCLLVSNPVSKPHKTVKMMC
ncbi:MAG: site-specific integrase [Deltaproteobacteria bacterium]|nr:site-specific integrase [Deltaproteobacteria bacterium]